MIGVAKVARGQGNVELIDVPEPTVIPGHVVLEVRAAGVCGTDLHIYHDEYPSVPPVIMGHEVAGIVAAVGAEVTSCQVGDRVTSETFFYTCGRCAYCRAGHINLCLQRKSIGTHVHGAFTRYVLVPARNLHPLPSNVDDLTGALTEPLACCVHALELSRVDPGDTVVVSGPGAIGLLMAQVARAAGGRVVVLGTGADEARLEMARTLGMERAINVQATAAREVVDELSDGLGAHVVFECAGAGASAQNSLSLLRRRGRYAQVGLFGKPIQWDMDQVCFREIQLSASFAYVPSAFDRALTLMSTAQVQVRPLISDVVPVTEWRHAFDTFEARSGLKQILTPVA